MNPSSVCSKERASINSFRHKTIFHEKEIDSYCTTSSNHLNDKNSPTVSCLSVEDIVSIYFPRSSIEQFIQICRKKQITRFKPDKSTNCDSTLRLINIQQLDHHWISIHQELSPSTQTISQQKGSK